MQRQRGSWTRIVAVVFFVVLAGGAGSARQLSAFPGGTPRFVTNAGPYCAFCHSSVSKEQLRDMPPEAQASQLPEGRHFSEINGGEENYQKLSPADREKLIAAIKTLDAHSGVSIVASSARVRPSGPLTVTVTTRGGAGPVVGVMLVDTDLRNQSSPIQTEGFAITEPPRITGPDGKPQTRFLDGRMAGLSKDINYVNVVDVKSDPDAGTYAACKVVYALRAPARPGNYTVTAAYLYGTEKATAIGRVEGPGGRVLPVGGRDAHAGRIAFAKPLKIAVR